MKIEIEFRGIAANEPAAEIVLEWIQNLIDDKSTDNLSPLRYANSIRVVE